ncbi:MAG: type VII secretion protein EssC [Lachnospiraceae bacterium]
MSRPEKFPRYKRSPRLILEVPNETIEIKRPETKASISKSSLIQIIVSPLVMLAVTVAVGILLKRGIYMFMSVASTVMTMLFSAIRYISEKKDCGEQNRKREEIYGEYLLAIRKRIYQLRKKEKEAYGHNSPTVREIALMIEDHSSRIYERNAQDDDFLTITVGYEKTGSACPIKVSYDELAVKKDELDLEAKNIRDEFCFVDKKSVVVDLKKANLGLVGEKEVVHEQLSIIIAQLTFFQSYHDIEIIAIYNETDSKQFDWLRWYPHCHIHALNVTGNISSEAIGDQVLASLHKILRDRKLRHEESKKKESFLPHFIFIIDEPKLIMDHAIMEYLGKDEQLGFSIIYTSYLQANLPETIGTIVQYKDAGSGRLVINEKKVSNIQFVPDRIDGIDVEWMARDLSVLVHEQGVVMSLPESITFFQMYHVDHPDALFIEKRWRESDSHKSLAVPLGIRVTGDLLMLNLHEKAHGPHGLIAGTTGSGKSEILQSYILSLAVNFHPYEVGFLLIDYKGGGMANLFEHLPHLLGTITNLDADASMRALASIRSELARRQRIFMENGVNHINAYNSLFKQEKVSEPIPHLFLISDEFAELKKEQPDFMTELVSTARLGRSLGIHLILATQKPNGVVTDQIWTNSRFKLALKVQNEADSKDVIKTPDAAYIVQPGRAYLQVGNNEIYELFQSAYSGAECIADSGEEIVDNRVYKINILGQAELINQDLSGEEKQNQESETQLDLTVKYIETLYEAMHLPPVRRPWLPPLEECMTSPYIQAENIGDVNKYRQISLSAFIGMADIPEEQNQTEYAHDFVREGNLAIFGAAGFGKSVLLTTVLLSLAVKNSAELLHYYILDMGNASLLPLRELPHTADYMSFDDTVKLSKFEQIITEELKKRKRLFAKAGAMNFEMYNRISEEKMPAIIWAIDNYDVNKEMDQELETVVLQIARDGIGLGIYVMLAGSRPGVLRFSIINNFKNKIALYMFDRAELNAAVGRGNLSLPEIKGRAYVRLNNVNQMQVYSVFEIKEEDAYVDGIKMIIGKISDGYGGGKPAKLPLMPEKLTAAILSEYITREKSENMIPIGLNVLDITCRYLDLSKGRQLIVGGTGSGRTNLLKVLLRNRARTLQTYVIDDKAAELYKYRNDEGVTYLSTAEGIIGFLETVRLLVEQRQENFLLEQEKNQDVIPRQFFAALPPVMIVVAEWEEFLGMIAASKDLSAEQIIMSASDVNITLIAAAHANRLKGFDNLSKFMKESIYGIVTGNFTSQNHFSSMTGRVAADNAPGVGYIIEKGNLVKVQLAKEE